MVSERDGAGGRCCRPANRQVLFSSSKVESLVHKKSGKCALICSDV